MMGTGLITYGDELLEVGGALADDLDCCCDDCPPCCARIVNGALLDGSVHLFVTGDDYSMEVVITTPSGDRLVCKDDVVEFEFTLVPNGEDPIPAELLRDAFITWDPAWKYVSHSPAVSGTDGWVNELGFVIWGTDVTANTYTASLKYFPCFNDPNPGIGAIHLGFTELDLETFIEVDPCPDQSCCDVDPVCAPCCYTMDAGVWDEEKGRYVFLVEAATYYLIVEISLPDNANKRVCAGESVNVTIRGATRSLPIFIGTDLDVGAVLDGFVYLNGATPAPASSGLTLIEWGNEDFETVYSFPATLPCETTSNSASIVITAEKWYPEDIEGSEPVEVAIPFTRCDTPIETDCCNNDCQNCCSNIQGGVLEDGAILFFLAHGDYTMEITLITPSGTRLVCEDDIIAITIVFTGPVPNEPYASWDPAWKHAGHLPEVNPLTGFFSENGLIEWGQSLTEEYSFSLKYSPCLLSENPTLGLIRIGSHAATDMAFDFAVDIELDHCEMIDCCEIEAVCEPCCWELVGGVYDEETGVFRYYAEAANFWVVVEVSISQPLKRLTCADDSVSINVKIGSRDRETLESHLFNVSVTIDGFGYSSSSPVPATAEPVVGEPGEVVWDDNPATSYSVDMAARCGVREPGGITVVVSDTIAFTQIGAIGIGFVECLTSENCNCCCQHCCGDCHFPVTEGICELPGPPMHEDGGPTQIVDFVTNVTASSPVFCDGTTDTIEFTQVGESRHYITCGAKCPEDLSAGYCASSACNFDVTIENDCPPDDGYGVSTLRVFYGLAGWAISSGGVGYIYWITGRTSYSGDCNGATASGTFVLSGVTYNWTTTFTVQRSGSDPGYTCPLEEEEEGGGGV